MAEKASSQKSFRRTTGEAGSKLRTRPSIPHKFVLDALDAARPRTNWMFGCLAIYVGPKIVLLLRNSSRNPADNGVWLATTPDHHETLRREFPNMRSIALFGKDITGWQVLPMDSPDFEASGIHACELVLRHDPRIGKVPVSKRR